MSLKENFERLVHVWPAYRDLGSVAKTEPAYQLVTEGLPAELRSLLEQRTHLKLEGSTGRGNITPAPWIATFDTRITDSATRGYYVVYLYSLELHSLYLCLALGATQFEELYTKRRPRYEAMAHALTRLRPIVAPHLPATLAARLISGTIDLETTSKHKLHQNYEHGIVYALKYDLAALPAEPNLVADYLAFVDLYQATVEDPLTPSAESLLGATEAVLKAQQKPEVSTFTPRPAKKVRNANSSSTAHGRRYSKESKIVGDVGEWLVVEYERNRLLNAGRSDLAALVKHEEAEGNRPGWDISSYEEDGTSRHIEVKATDGETLNTLELTDNEWTSAQKLKGRYCLYLVTNTRSAHPNIEILIDPAGYIAREELALRPVRFELSLHTLK